MNGFVSASLSLYHIYVHKDKHFLPQWCQSSDFSTNSTNTHLMNSVMFTKRVKILFFYNGKTKKKS